MFKRYTVVIVRPTEIPTIERYLYGHTEIMLVVSQIGDDARCAAILETVSTYSDHDAQLIADYQADRIRSGMYAVGGPFSTNREAATHATESLERVS